MRFHLRGTLNVGTAGRLALEGAVELNDLSGDPPITASTFQSFLQNTLANMANTNGVDLHLPEHEAGIAAYTMPTITVGGSVLQDFKRYRLAPKPDMTAFELFVLTLMLYDKVKGNMVACLLENGLARHLEEVT
jgi:hypothetical protein